MKTDIRVRYTKSIIRESFFACLNKKGALKDVTVTEVCELAEINRTTFYKYYKDCFDLVEQIESELTQEFRCVFTNTGNAFSRDFAEAIVNLLNKYDKLIESYADRSIEGGLIEKLVSISHELCIDIWKEHLPKGKEKEIEMLFSMASSTFFQLVISEHGKYSNEEVLRFMYKLLGNVTEQYRDDAYTA